VVRRLLVLSLLGCVVVAGFALVTGRGSHAVPKPPRFNQASAPSLPESYQYGAGGPSHSFSYVQPVVVSYLDDVPTGAKVLDLGCGTGELLASLRNRKWELTGVDISASGIANARRAYPEITFIEMDATGDLSSHLAMGTYDLVVSTETLEHVVLPRLFLKNAYDALAPGGRLVMSVPYNGYAKQLAVAALGRTDAYYNPLWDWGHIKFFSVESLSTLLWEAGFDDLEYQGVGRIPYFWKSMVFVAHKKP
jgi:SAM-dependent methyltransferase